jgi:hypothetical protein
MWRVPEPHGDWIDAFLRVQPPPPQDRDSTTYWFSTFSAVVRAAREATGRDKSTGQIVHDEMAHSWLGALAYLVMLDQVGECFRPEPAPRTPPLNRAILRALAYFGPAALGDSEALAIYALRCAFAHDFALVNVGRGPQAAQLHHRFVLVDDKESSLVQLPDAPWDGNLNGHIRSNQTLVNLRELGDVAEQVVESLQRASADRRLVVALNGGIDVLFTRFTAMSWPDKPSA